LGFIFSVFIFSLSGIYESWRGRSLFQQVKVLTLSWFSVVTLLILLAFLTKTSAVFSRQWMVAWAGGAWLLLLCFRFSLAYLLRTMRSRGWNTKNIIIIGAGTSGKDAALRLGEASWTGFNIVAFLDDAEELQGTTVCGARVLGGIDHINSILGSNNIDEVWIALPLSAEQRVKSILHALRHSTVTIRYVPGIFSSRLLSHSVSEISGVLLMDLSTTPMEGVNRYLKAIEDRLLALSILIFISPLLLLITIGVKLSSPGPVLFKQLRHGWDGKPIKVYKFRTMIVHSEEGGAVTQACKGDDRVTPFGAFLRRTSLDELPQFFNVLQGRMSIVGPRPHALAHNELYKDQIDAYMLRHKVKPGITGWAQINGWRGETDTLEKMQKRVEYDLYYIDNWSLWFDFKIIFLSLFKGFVGKSAY
jgi:putative colanic acid biosynthesis UDP-glucose lipid carrier transferase